MRPVRSGSLVTLAVLLPALYLALSLTIYLTVESKSLGANDYYSRWMGARLFFERGLDPYSDDVTRQIQLGMFGHLVPEGRDQVAFAYPFYAALYTLPFIGLPFALASSLWVGLLILLIGGAAVASAFLFDWRPSATSLVGLLAFGLLTYPAVRGFFLGQYVLIVAACLAFGLLLMKHHHEGWAACLFALSTVKPHIALAPLAVILAWAAWHGRWTIIRSFVVTLTAILLVSTLLLPAWPYEFVQALGRYSSYVVLPSPLQVGIETILPSVLSQPVSTVTSILLFGLLGYELTRTVAADWMDFIPTIELALIVTTCAMFRTATADQTILLIPWVHWLSAWMRSGQQRKALLAGLIVLGIPWILFLGTLSGNQEAPIATTGFVTLTIIAYFYIYRERWAASFETRAVRKLSD
jgi:Glycosyltransferase family 87